MRFLLFLSGLMFSAIAVCNIVMGAEWTFTHIASLIKVDAPDFSAFSAPYVDGTVRFWSVFELIMGLIMMNVARDFRNNRGLVPVLCGIMILAGAARLWAIYSTSDVSMLSFLSAMLEILPAVFILILYVTNRRRRDF